MPSQVSRTSTPVPAGVGRASHAPPAQQGIPIVVAPAVSRDAPLDRPRVTDLVRWVLADAAGALRALEGGEPGEAELAWLFAHVDQLRERVEDERRR